jgi:hypothetical protein
MVIDLLFSFYITLGMSSKPMPTFVAKLSGMTVCFNLPLAEGKTYNLLNVVNRRRGEK